MMGYIVNKISQWDRKTIRSKKTKLGRKGMSLYTRVQFYVQHFQRAFPLHRRGQQLTIKMAQYDKLMGLDKSIS